MTVHQCPECPLRFASKPEMEWHLREEHPEFHHEYPARPRHAKPARAETPPRPEERAGAEPRRGSPPR